MSAYAAVEIAEQIARGPAEGEDFYRLQMCGDGASKWVNVTPEQAEQIAMILLPAEWHDYARQYGVAEAAERAWRNGRW